MNTLHSSSVYDAPTPQDNILALAQLAHSASHSLATASEGARNQALLAIHETLACCFELSESHEESSVHHSSKGIPCQERDVHNILKANQKDLSLCTGAKSDPLYARLALKSTETILQGILDVVALPDPIGCISLATRLDTDLDLYRVSCPLGTLLIIFEARPEIVVQLSCLAIKSGNSVILKGGKEAHHTNLAIYHHIKAALATTSISPDCVQLISHREEVASLLRLDSCIDLVIPRGSKQLVQYVQNNTRIPVLGHADGLCSIYIDVSADLAKCVHVILDAKTSYPAACNSVETVLIHESALARILPSLAKALLAAGVELRVDGACMSFLSPDTPQVRLAQPQDYDTEFLSLTLAIQSVPSLDAAIQHIHAHGSRHTDAILTQDETAARRFMDSVDAAGVYWNASTRFADGFRYGFGAEIGVSTSKTHARGPVGLEGLVIYKYKLFGNGQGSLDYGGNGGKHYLHEPIKKISGTP